jgi:hypothetical protein
MRLGLDINQQAVTAVLAQRMTLKADMPHDQRLWMKRYSALS